MIQILYDLAAIPDGPGTPFGTPLIATYDTIRVACILASVYLSFQCCIGAYLVASTKQRARFIALALLAISVIGTEAAHIGDLAHYRLAVNAVGIALSVYGLHKIREIGHNSRTRPKEIL